MDFNGTMPGNVAVTSTSAGFRLRNAFGEAAIQRALHDRRRRSRSPRTPANCPAPPTGCGCRSAVPAWRGSEGDARSAAGFEAGGQRLHAAPAALRGEIGPDAVVTPADTEDVQVATLAYGLDNWYFVQGDTARARQWFERSVRSGGWPGFGFIVSEVELQRLR